MPGVVSAQVSCTTGKAICKVKPDVDVDVLVDAVEREGFDAAPKN